MTKQLLFTIGFVCCFPGCVNPDTKQPPKELKTSLSSQDPIPSNESLVSPAPQIIDDNAIEEPQSVKISDASPIPATKQDPKHVPTIDELMLFFPSQHPEGNWTPHDLAFEDVWFSAEDGTRLHGWYCPCENPRAYVLYAHGNAGNLSDRSSILAHLQKEVRVSTLIFDYRGYGRSAGRPTVAGAIADARAASKCLADQAGISESDLVFMGRSLGAAILVQLAGEIHPRGLIIESSFASLKNVASHHYPKLAWLVPKKKLDSVTAIKSYQGQLLQSHGSTDRTIPLESAMQLFEAANQPKQFVRLENTDHNDSSPNSYYDTLSKFIGSLPR